MNNQRLPGYPEHPEPTDRTDKAEFERETRPRTMPGTILWMGLALIVVLFFTQKFVAEHVGKEQAIEPVKAKPRGN